MRILDLHIDGFGKFHDLSVSFDKDLNVVYGRNEAGKSTLHTFIRCMLFGLERGRGRRPARIFTANMSRGRTRLYTVGRCGWKRMGSFTAWSGTFRRIRSLL